MNDWILFAIAVSVIVFVVAGMRLIGFFARRKRVANGPDYQALAQEIGLRLISDRWLFDERVILMDGEFRGFPAQCEIGGGEKGYLRLRVQFPENLAFGLKIASEDEDRLADRVRKIREIEIENPRFDPLFLIMMRDEDRVRALIEGDVEDALISLRKKAHTVRLNDAAVFIYQPRITPADELRELLTEATNAASALHRRVQTILKDEDEDQRNDSYRHPFDRMPVFTGQGPG